MTDSAICCVQNKPHSLRNPLVFSDLKLVCPKQYKLELKVKVKSMYLKENEFSTKIIDKSSMFSKGITHWTLLKDLR